MISPSDVYQVLTAVVPLYVAMILAYASVKWWKIFTPDECSGINRFVALFAVPLVSFQFISSNNPYTMNLHFIVADTLQKLIVLTLLSLWSKLTSHGRGSLEWVVTLFSLSTLPNTLVVGIPLLQGMYGPSSSPLMVQSIVLQCIIWYTILLFLFEYRGAKTLIMEQFPRNTAASIISFHVDSDIVSLDGKEPLQTEAEVGEDGKLHVIVLKSSSSSRSHGFSMTPRGSNLSNAEIRSLQPSTNPTPRGSSFNRLEEENGSCPNPTASDKRIPVLVGDVHDGSNGPSLSKLHPNSSHIDINLESLSKPPASVMARLILIMVWRKLIRNPNTYSSLIGLIWSLVSFRWGIEMPAILASSISILSDAGIGMAMFSLGLFMALQPRIIACGNAVAAFAMAVRFIAGPAVMAAASIAVGLRGTLLRIAIVQAALPLGVVPFIFAKEYNVHADILSTGVIFGMLIALPVTLVYYILLEL